MNSQANPFTKRVWWAVRPLWYWRLLRLFLRSFWIAVALGIAGWQLSLAQGWPLGLVVWGAVSYAAFMVLFPSSLLWPIPVPLLTRRLDAAFGLHDRLSTAGEIAARAPDNYLEQRLLGSADRLLHSLRGRLARQNHMPWTDLALAVVAMAMLFAIYLNATTLEPPELLTAQPPGAPNLPAPIAEEPVTLPGAAPNEELNPPAAEEGTEGETPEGENATGDALDPSAAQAAMDALTNALGEQSLTQSAAADLAQGDAAGAAERLRELADQAGSLDPAAREDLAESLRAAAEGLEGTAPGVADQIAEAAEAIAPDQGDPAESAAEAAAGLEDLATLLEALDQSRSSGSSGASGGTGGAGAGDNQGSDVGRESNSSGSTERLQSEGQPVELTADEAPDDENGVLQPPEHSGPATDTTNTPYTQSGASGEGGSQPADPLSFPWRLRRVIQRFFSPQ